MIWSAKPNLEILNAVGQNNMTGHLGIEFIEAGDDYLKATMPVDERTKQPMGLLHGGASAVLAETMGSVASMLTLKNVATQGVVGIEINANHLSSAKSGKVIGTVKPIKIGRTLQVWDIQIEDEKGKKICISRLTTMIISTDKKA